MQTIQNTLPFDKVKNAFLSSLMPDPPSDADFKQLFYALEAWYNEENKIVNFSKILEAITHRQKSCIHGIFPRIVSKPSGGTTDQPMMDNEKRLEAEKED